VEIHHILCPSDFSEVSRHAIDQAIALAGAYNAKIVALHTVSPLTSAVEAPVMDECRDRLREWFARATKAGIAVDAEIGLGLPVHRILDRASSLPADVIVMSTHGASGFVHFVHGSTTEKVLRKATRPVLTVSAARSSYVATALQTCSVCGRFFRCFVESSRLGDIVSA